VEGTSAPRRRTQNASASTRGLAATDVQTRSQSRNPRERLWVRDPHGIYELASVTGSRNELRRKDPITRQRRTKRRAPTRCRARDERPGQGDGSWRERELTCVEALGYGGGLPQESPADRARHTRGERRPPHARDLLARGPHRSPPPPPDGPPPPPGPEEPVGTMGSRRPSLGLRSVRRCIRGHWTAAAELRRARRGGSETDRERGGGPRSKYFWCARINRIERVGGDFVWAAPGARSGAGARPWGQENFWPPCTSYYFSTST
jgi:hypothetical protein